MNLSMTFSPSINHLLVLHEMFRRLGFSSDQLFVCMYPPRTVQFELRVGPPDKPHDDTAVERFVVDVPNDALTPTALLRDEWLLALEWWNTPQTPTPQRDIVMGGSPFTMMSVPLIAALHKRGLYPLPKPKN